MSIPHSIRNPCKAYKIVWSVYFTLRLISLFSLFRRINILLARNFMPKVPGEILVMSVSVFEGNVMWNTIWWWHLGWWRSLIADFMAKTLSITFSDHRTAELIFRYRTIYNLSFRIIIVMSNSCFLHETILQWASNNQTSYRFRVRGVTITVWQ